MAPKGLGHRKYDSWSGDEQCLDDGWTVIEEDTYAKWDDDYQSKFHPLSVQQELVTEAKHTWQNLSPTAVREGLTSVAAIAAREATARMQDAALECAVKARDVAAIAAREAAARVPDAAAGYVAKARGYVKSLQQRGESQQAGRVGYVTTNSWQNSRASHVTTETRQAPEAVGQVVTVWEPPVNSFTLSEKAVESETSSLGESQKGEGTLRKDLRKNEGRSEKGVKEPGNRDPVLDRTAQHRYRMRQPGGVTVEREYFAYDPLGDSGYWKRTEELKQHTRLRKQRLKEEWLQKEEKPNRLLERIGGEIQENSSIKMASGEGGGDLSEEKPNRLLERIGEEMEEKSSLRIALRQAGGEDASEEDEGGWTKQKLRVGLNRDFKDA